MEVRPSDGSAGESAGEGVELLPGHLKFACRLVLLRSSAWFNTRVYGDKKTKDQVSGLYNMVPHPRPLIGQDPALWKTVTNSALELALRWNTSLSRRSSSPLRRKHAHS
ncbi:hypothetical protein NDU88_000199 [Pleurodeles waltl]|uniref:BTB domain-containing protein n=1 Tax=Pleurodeles waltl TaxID=8319 RepID=A0AAV7U6S8_PLEWA|nr:hypothetical protein NDU88_000199 [Pleurodeles waltl]